MGSMPAVYSRKERVLRALRHRPVDRIPTQINYTGSMGSKLAAQFGVSTGQLPDVLDNHLLRVDIDFERRLDSDGAISYDWWGVGFSVESEGYLDVVNPLAGVQDLDSYIWPDPDGAGLLMSACDAIAHDAGERFVVPNLGFALFERAWTMRGLTQLLMDLALDPGYASELLDRITDIQLRLIDRYIALGVDGAYFGDDYGAQKNLIVSPRMWREFLKPRLARMFEPFHSRSMPIIMHSDGQIQRILPDLVEIGLTVLNPVQPDVLDHKWLVETFDQRLAYYGGISTQTTLPFGTPDEVTAAVEQCANALAPEGTGLLLAPSHRMMTDIPMKNVVAMLDAFHNLH
ncbi:MAG: uroporphyrinogen decarboxylase family protein [Caldilineaceae bacterium]